MSAATSLPDVPVLSGKAEALAVFHAAQKVTEIHLRRLERIEDGLVRLMDRLELVRAAIARGQKLQVDALRLAALASAAAERGR